MACKKDQYTFESEIRPGLYAATKNQKPVEILYFAPQEVDTFEEVILLAFNNLAFRINSYWTCPGDGHYIERDPVLQTMETTARNGDGYLFTSTQFFEMLMTAKLMGTLRLLSNDLQPKYFNGEGKLIDGFHHLTSNPAGFCLENALDKDILYQYWNVFLLLRYFLVYPTVIQTKDQKTVLLRPYHITEPNFEFHIPKNVKQAFSVNCGDLLPPIHSSYYRFKKENQFLPLPTMKQEGFQFDINANERNVCGKNGLLFNDILDLGDVKDLGGVSNLIREACTKEGDCKKYLVKQLLGQKLDEKTNRELYYSRVLAEQELTPQFLNGWQCGPDVYLAFERYQGNMMDKGQKRFKELLPRTAASQDSCTYACCFLWDEFIQMFEAAKMLSDAGIVHGDLSPRNLVYKGNIIKPIDFQLSGDFVQFVPQYGWWFTSQGCSIESQMPKSQKRDYIRRYNYWDLAMSLWYISVTFIIPPEADPTKIFYFPGPSAFSSSSSPFYIPTDVAQRFQQACFNEESYKAQLKFIEACYEHSKIELEEQHQPPLQVINFIY